MRFFSRAAKYVLMIWHGASYSTVLGGYKIIQTNSLRGKGETDMGSLQGRIWPLLAFCSMAARAELPAYDDDAALQDLLNVIDQETTVATATKLNSDYVPGMVTILHGEDMMALGVRNVWEALATVPGFQTLRNPLGEALVTVRGVPFPFNAGNIKIMLNSIPMSQEYASYNSAIIEIPMQQIDRIEVVRGPGSALFGSFALMGLVNIITRQEDSRAYVTYDNNGNRSGGVNFSTSNSPHDVQMSVTLNKKQEDEAPLPIGQQSRHLLPPPPPNPNGPPPVAAPPIEAGTASQDSAMFDLRWHDSELHTGFVHRDAGNEYNSSNRLQRGVEFRQGWQWSDNWRSQFIASQIESQVDNGFLLFDGAQSAVQLDQFFKIGQDQEWLISTRYEREKVQHAFQRLINGTGAIVEDYIARNNSFTVQDQYRFSDNFMLTGGLRFDRRDDIDKQRVTPRLAAVWQMAEHHVVKAQYSEGFRGPTFFEWQGMQAEGEPADFELNKTSELSYIYRLSDRTARLTAFHSNLDNMFFGRLSANPPPPPPAPPPPPSLHFGNTAQASANGIELEWEQQLSDSFKWNANLSVINARDNRNPQDEDNVAYGSARHLANVSAFYRPLRQLLLTGHWLYVGPRELNDAQIGGYNIFDLSLSAPDLWRKWNLRGGIKNALDQHPQYANAVPDRIDISEYSGRYWWIEVAYAP